jgi:hypothetical protein
MTITMPPREQLISADADIKSTKKEVTRSERAERNAQKLADDTRGLAAAAERDLKNAEARYRVLFAAAEETKGLRKQRAEIEQELAEIGRADKVSAATRAAVGPLDDAVKAVTPLENATRQARDTIEHAKSRVQEAAEKVTSAGGQAEAPAGRPGKTSPRAQNESSSDKQNSLDTITQELEQDHQRLQGLYKQIHGSLKGLQAQATAVQTAATEAADFANEQTAEKERLLNERAKIDAKLKGQPSPPEVAEAETDRDTARRRFEDAPGAERQAQEALKLAREAREDAQRRYREALDRRDRAEGLFITDIDITGPNAAGIFTATAVLAEDPPTGYELHWSSNAGTVKPDTGKTVSFNTGKLPPGSYDIEVSLVHP